MEVNGRKVAIGKSIFLNRGYDTKHNTAAPAFIEIIDRAFQNFIARYPITIHRRTIADKRSAEFNRRRLTSLRTAISRGKSHKLEVINLIRIGDIGSVGVFRAATLCLPRIFQDSDKAASLHITVVIIIACGQSAVQISVIIVDNAIFFPCNGSEARKRHRLECIRLNIGQIFQRELDRQCLIGDVFPASFIVAAACVFKGTFTNHRKRARRNLHGGEIRRVGKCALADTNDVRTYIDNTDLLIIFKSAVFDLHHGQTVDLIRNIYDISAICLHCGFLIKTGNDVARFIGIQILSKAENIQTVFHGKIQIAIHRRIEVIVKTELTAGGDRNNIRRIKSKLRCKGCAKSGFSQFFSCDNFHSEARVCLLRYGVVRLNCDRDVPAFYIRRIHHVLIHHLILHTRHIHIKIRIITAKHKHTHAGRICRRMRYNQFSPFERVKNRICNRLRFGKSICICRIIQPLSRVIRI